MFKPFNAYALERASNPEFQQLATHITHAPTLKDLRRILGQMPKSAMSSCGYYEDKDSFDVIAQGKHPQTKVPTYVYLSFDVQRNRFGCKLEKMIKLYLGL